MGDERLEFLRDDSECDGTDAAHPAYWRGHDHAVAVLCQKITEILNGKDDGKGIASEPWEPVRRRLLALRNSRGWALEKRIREAASAIRLLMANIPEATCPNASDERFSVDYGIGHGHICDLCNGTGITATSEAFRMAEAALKALEGGGDEQAKRKQIREDNMIGEAGI